MFKNLKIGKKLGLGFGVVLTLVFASGAVASEKPTFDFNWYGFVKLDASYDQSLTSHGNFTMWVQPQQNGEDDEQFNMTHKQTRFGVSVKGKGYENATVGGKLEFDFYGGGGAENKAMLLLRHAYFTVQSGQFQLLAGQSWDLISPLNPSTLNYSVWWGCGNIGYRRPQLRLTYTVEPSPQTEVMFGAGFYRTIGSDLTPTFSLATEVSDGSDDGTDAGIPSFQGVLDVKHKSPSGWSLRAGVSGLYGQLKAEGTLGTDETYESNAVAGHLMVTLPQGFGFSSEVFSGSNLGSYNGGITNVSTIDGISTKGFWASVWTKLNEKIKLSAGYGVDNPDNDDLASGDRCKNSSYFGNLKYSPIPQFTVGVEISQWETNYLDADAAKALRAQTSFVLNF